MAPKLYKPEFETLQLHAGQDVDPTTNARAPPIYASTSFVFNDSAHGADLTSLRASGNVYSRISNPTVEVFERRVASLEGGAEAVAASSGQAAQFMAISTIAGAGDNIVSTTYLYGGTYNQFKVLFKKYGISAKFVTSDDPAAFAATIDQNTKAVYVESIGNPKYNVSPISEMAKVPLIVDNTLGMGGYLIRPIELGADIVVHSATKWIGGHGTTIAGVIIDSGNFDWTSGRFPSFTSPAEGYHGLKFSETFGKVAFAVKLRMEILRDLGATLNPFAAFLLLKASRRSHSVRSVTLTMPSPLRDTSSNITIVAWVSYVGLESHPSHELALETFREGAFGGMLNFGVKGGNAAMGSKVVDSLRLVSNLANIGDAKTLVVHPASTTHQQLTVEEQLASGVSPDLIRVSIGIENIKDIIVDFEGALKVVP
ncbi:O-acetylhomoserine ami [Russula compacta]|nr:O-acetylhomoserine ami [Russula compacta]